MASFAGGLNAGTGSHDVFVPELWSKFSVMAFERSLIMAKRVRRFDVEVKGRGDKLNIPQVQNLSTAAVGATGTYAAQAPAETSYGLGIDQWKEASISVHDALQIQAGYSLLEDYTKKIGYALAKDVEDYLLALYANLAQSVGTSGVAVTDDALLNAIQLLDEGDAPEEDRTAIFRPASKRTLMKIDKFVDASKTGLGKSAAITGLFGEIYGIPVFFSNNVVSSSGVRNLVFHKEGFFLAIQQDIKIERFRLKLADDVVGHVLYGAIEGRDSSAMGTGAVQLLT